MSASQEPPQHAGSTGNPAIVRLVIGIGAGLLVLVLISILGFALTGNFVIGSGNVQTESRTVTGFSQVALDGMGDLTIQQTGTESLTIEAEDNILPLITSNVANGRLTIGENRLLPFSIIIPRKPVHYLLTVKDLSDLDISGSGSASIASLTTTNLNVVINGSVSITIGHLTASTFHDAINGSGSVALSDVNVTTLGTAINGSGNITTSGTTQDQEIAINGSGSYQARNLTSADARVDISGSGNVTVTASNTLGVSISGSGSVTYCGNPTVTQHISGSGSIQHC
jgi:hypothetical protein